ncbi:hypothetical protein COU74_02670 [Candidatus Peregrinibacteria bacterium CG10_big_fil_rev_8_21_14_0_10_36_19]|nr:MAG: hypothetical protein COU74_02670 [Candidatus Peregrinibacteria bacterium CG10_big_fil_rev_8_21_14_0_10_36_19]
MNHAIILAAGSGERMNGKTDKMLLPINGRPLIYYSLMAFNDHPEIDNVVIVGSKVNKEEFEKIIKTYHFGKVSKVVVGAETRQKSLNEGVKCLKKIDKSDIVLIHNGANPLPSEREITETIEKTSETGACIVGHSVTSTMKEVEDEHIIKTHDRRNLFAAETPQAATYEVLLKAIENANKKGLQVTDEAMMFEAINQKTAYVKADENNFKVTNQADYVRLKSILGDIPDDYRIGLGQDSHSFDTSKKGLTLAGILLKDEFAMKANSDGDVILHAIFNAISQAIGEKSLGFYADPECEKGVTDSKKYLEIILKKMKQQKFKINSLGLMIEAKTPKFDPLVTQIKKSLSQILDLEPRRIGVTATTGEELTSFGQGLGIQCFAIISLAKVD